MCELLLTVFITGAVESAPGWMTIDYIDRWNHGPWVQTIHIPTKSYLECWDNGYPQIIYDEHGRIQKD